MNSDILTALNRAVTAAELVKSLKFVLTVNEIENNIKIDWFDRTFWQKMVDGS